MSIFSELPLKSANFAKYAPIYSYLSRVKGLFRPTIPIYTLIGFNYPSSLADFFKAAKLWSTSSSKLEFLKEARWSSK